MKEGGCGQIDTSKITAMLGLKSNAHIALVFVETSYTE